MLPSALGTEAVAEGTSEQGGKKNAFPVLLGQIGAKRSGLCWLTPRAPQFYLAKRKGDPVLLIRGQWASPSRASSPGSLEALFPSPVAAGRLERKNGYGPPTPPCLCSY